MIRRRLVAAALLPVALGTMSSACTSGQSGSSPTTAAAAPISKLTSIASLGDLARQLEAKGITCKLEYEGLQDNDKTLSICTIDGSQATLTIWNKPEVLSKFLASNLEMEGYSAVGANWTVDVDDAATADKVASALGGTVKGAAPGTTR